MRWSETAWQCDLTTYVCTSIPRNKLAPMPADTTPSQDQAAQESGQDSQEGDAASPDGQWTAFARASNLFVRSTADGKEISLTHDGTAERPYGAINWAPDSQSFVAYRITPVPLQPCYLIASSPAGGTRGVLHQHEYPQPGDPFSQYEMWLFDPTKATATRAQVEIIDFGDTPGLHWDKDGQPLYGSSEWTGAISASGSLPSTWRTGESTTLVDDHAKTFIDSTVTYVYYVKDGDEILYASERDGWRHLYLYDGRTGALKNQVTHGPWVVRDVDHVDEDARQIWFTGQRQKSRRGPVSPPPLPRQLRRHRPDRADGRRRQPLRPVFARPPVADRHVFAADLPPVHTLRRAADGTHLCDLEQPTSRP